MTSPLLLTSAPTLSLDMGSNGLDSMFSTIFPFIDPIMYGLRNGTLSWADAVELEEAEAATAVPATAVPATATATVAQSPRLTIIRPPIRAPNHTKPCKTIIIRNLPRDCEELESALQLTFMRFSSLKDIYIPKNMDAASPYFGTIKGFALIKFNVLADAINAYNDGAPFKMGRNTVSIEFAKEDR